MILQSILDTEDFERRLCVSDRNAVQLAELARQSAEHVRVAGIVAFPFYLDAHANLRSVC